MTEASLHYHPASERRHYLYSTKVVKRSLNGVPYPESQMDWDELRKAKQRCETCLEFNNVLGMCTLWQLPSMTCDRFAPQCVTEQPKDPDPELIAIMIKG